MNHVKRTHSVGAIYVIEFNRARNKIACEHHIICSYEERLSSFVVMNETMVEGKHVLPLKKNTRHSVGGTNASNDNGKQRKR